MTAAAGQLITGSFMDYAMPRAAVMPNVECALEEVPCKTNPLGVKGIGESGTIGAPPAVINAVIDALRPLGVDAIDMPATPLRVWETIQRAKAKGRRRVGVSTRCSLRPRPEGAIRRIASRRLGRMWSPSFETHSLRECSSG